MWINLNEKEIAVIKKALSKQGKEGKSAITSIDHFLELEDDKDLVRYREAAQSKSHEGELEVDEEAVVSKGDDPGAYVMAWLWVTDEEAGIESPEE